VLRKGGEGGAGKLREDVTKRIVGVAKMPRGAKKGKEEVLGRTRRAMQGRREEGAGKGPREKRSYQEPRGRTLSDVREAVGGAINRLFVRRGELGGGDKEGEGG